MKVNIIQKESYKQLTKVVRLSSLVMVFAVAGCGGDTVDVIKPGVTDKGGAAYQGKIPDANLISYNSGAIALASRASGSSQKRTIEFKVSNNDVPLPFKSVEVELTRSPADFSFVTDGNRSKKTLETDAKGILTVQLYPGVLPGPVEIKATLADNPNLVALSKGVSVSTGLPDQRGVSLSIEGKVALNSNLEGDSTKINIRAVDRLGNPVSDGTTVNFISEGGRVQPSCSTTGGGCSVELSVQNPRPVNGRVTVLAYLEGDKSYRDVNGDNIYTVGKDELYNNIGDFFRDDNENNEYDVGEFIYRRGASGVSCKDSTFLEPNIQDTCNKELSAVLRRQSVFAFSDNYPTIVPNSLDRNSKTSGVLTFKVYGNSNLTVPMPSGTKISVEVNDVKEQTSGSDTNSFSGQSGSGGSTNGGTTNGATEQKTCKAKMVKTGNNPVPDVFSLGSVDTFKSSGIVNYFVEFKNCESGDGIYVSVTAPDGITARFPISYR